MNFGEVYLKKAALGPGESSLDAITTYRYDTPIIDKIKLNDRQVWWSGEYPHHVLRPHPTPSPPGPIPTTLELLDQTPIVQA